MVSSNVIDKFKESLKFPIILYVDVYPYIISKKGEVLFLVLKRRDDVLLAGNWQVVCGKIKEGEKIKDAFARQVQSKTGQLPKELYKLDFINTFYDDYYDSILMVPCAAANLKTTDIHIDTNLHTEYKWVNYTEACQLLVWENQKKCFNLVKELQQADPQVLRQRTLYQGPEYAFSKKDCS